MQKSGEKLMQKREKHKSEEKIFSMWLKSMPVIETRY